MSEESDPIDRGAARRNGWRLLLVVGGIALLGGAAGFMVGALQNHGGSAGHARHSPWFLILVLLVVLPLGAGGAVLVWLLRRPSYQRVMQYVPVWVPWAGRMMSRIGQQTGQWRDEASRDVIHE